MLGAGQRSHRIRFERRHRGDKSPSGNVLEEWRPLAKRWAGFLPVFGREQAAGGQLQSTMRGTLTVLSCAVTRDVGAADRVVFLSGPYAGRICEIRSIVPRPDTREIEFLIEHGPQT